MSDTQNEILSIAHIAELMARVPECKREVVAAQMIGVVNGYLIALDTEQAKTA